MYVQYWQKKLRHNKDILFPDTLRDEIASLTYDFSFAYLKEALYALTRTPRLLISLLCSVSTLVLLATDDHDSKPTFEHMIKKQIAALRKQLDETETEPSSPRNALQEPMPVAFREPHRPSQAHENQIPKNDGTADFDFYKRDVQNRAKAAVAYGRSFIA